MGEAAGTAAAMSLAVDARVRQVELSVLQSALRTSGALLEPREDGPAARRGPALPQGAGRPGSPITLLRGAAKRVQTQDLAPDHELIDLRGAIGHGEHACVSEVALQWILRRQSVRTVYLNRL